MQGARFEGLTIVSNSQTNTIFNLVCNTSGAPDDGGTYNTAHCKFSDIALHGECGRLFRLHGNGAGQVVTLNEWEGVVGYGTQNVAIAGWDYSQWCDSNQGVGVCRVSPGRNNAVGEIHNSADPTHEVGVYANNHVYLAVDTFGSLSGRVAIKINCAKQIKIGYLYNVPQAEGGQVVASAEAGSYSIFGPLDGSDYSLFHWSKSEFYQGGSFSSTATIDLADDAAVGILLPVINSFSAQNFWLTLGLTTNSATGNGGAWLNPRLSSGSPQSSKLSGDAAFAVSTGVLSGTTGSDGKITVSAAADQKFYIENRIGAAIKLQYTIQNMFQTT